MAKSKRKQALAKRILDAIGEPMEPTGQIGPATPPAASDRSFSANQTLLRRRDRGAIDTHVDNVRSIDTALIVVSAMNARLQDLLTPESVADLVESIREHGQIEPAEVYRIDSADPSDGPRYELISGSRRLFATRELGLPLRAVVYDTRPEDTAENQLRTMARSRAENISQQPSQYEYAHALARTMQRWPELTQRDLAAALGLAESTVSGLIAYAAMPVRVAQALGPHLRSVKPQVGSRWTRDHDTDSIVAEIEAGLAEGLTGARLVGHVDAKLRTMAQRSRKGSKGARKDQPSDRSGPRSEQQATWTPLPSGQGRIKVWQSQRRAQVALDLPIGTGKRALKEVVAALESELRALTNSTGEIK